MFGFFYELDLLLKAFANVSYPVGLEIRLPFVSMS
jgi:hypothetical protein